MTTHTDDHALTTGILALVGPVDAAVQHRLREAAEVEHLSPGATVCEAGAAATDVYVVLSGAVVVVDNRSDTPAVRRWLGSGDAFGELAPMLEQARSATVIARRASRIARIPWDVLAPVFAHTPGVAWRTARRIGRWLSTPSPPRDLHHVVALVLPTDTDWQAVLVDPLQASLAAFGAVEVVVVDGEPLHPRLDTAHQAGRRVLLVARSEAEAHTAIDHADLVVQVVDAASATVPHLGNGHTLVERWRVRVHESDAVMPIPAAKQAVGSEPDLLLNLRLGTPAHIHRLARFIAGEAVGLALSGGGARGFAHFGVVRALHEHGVPIDFLSGSSAGSLAAVLVAHEGDLAALSAERVLRLTAEGNPFADPTLPIVALTRGKRIRRALQRVFADLRIEDLWIPVRVAVADLGAGSLQSHGRGEAWRLCLASGSPPGLSTPVVVDGRVCCDAGILDNLPLGLLSSHCRVRLASMVSAARDLHIEADDFPSPWAVLRNRLTPSAPSIAPDLADILGATAVLASRASKRRVQQEADLLIEPELDGFSILDFSRHAELAELAYAHTVDQLENTPSIEVLRARLAGRPA